MMTSSNGNISRVTGLLCGEFTGDRWIPRTKASDTEFWCFLWSVPEPTVEQTLKTDELRRHRAHHDAIVMLKRSGDIMFNFPTHVVFVFSRGKSQIICGYLSIFQWMNVSKLLMSKHTYNQKCEICAHIIFWSHMLIYKRLNLMRSLRKLTSNIRRTLCHIIIDNSAVVGAAPTTSSLSTSHMV